MASHPLQVANALGETGSPTQTPIALKRGGHEEPATAVPSRLAEPLTYLANDNAHEIDAIGIACKAMLRGYWMHLRPPIRDGLLNQTGVVLDPAEWAEDEVVVSIDSFQTMLRSLVQLQVGKRPNLAIALNGNFQAAWKDKHSKVVFEFSSRDRVRWLISVLGEEGWNRAGGVTNVRELPEICQFHLGRGAIDGQE